MPRRGTSWTTLPASSSDRSLREIADSTKRSLRQPRGTLPLPSPEGRGWTAAGVFTSRSGTGEGLLPGTTGWLPNACAPPNYSDRSTVTGSSVTARMVAGSAASKAAARMMSAGIASIAGSVGFTW